MGRLVASIVLLALAVTMVACAHLTASGGTLAGPSLTVTWAQDSGGLDGVYSAVLTPSGSPSGIIALKVVHDGRVHTIARYRFHAVKGRGRLQVQASKRRISVTWQLPTSDAPPTGGEVVIPPRMLTSGASWGGTTGVPSSGLGEETIWEQERALGHPPSGNSLIIGSFDALVRGSVQYRHRTAYCLTLKVEPR